MTGSSTIKLPQGFYRLVRDDFIDHQVNPRKELNKKDRDKRIYWRWEINA